MMLGAVCPSQRPQPSSIQGNSNPFKCPNCPQGLTPFSHWPILWRPSRKHSSTSPCAKVSIFLKGRFHRKPMGSKSICFLKKTGQSPALPMPEPLRHLIGEHVRQMTGSTQSLDNFKQPLGDPGLLGPASMPWRVHAHFISMMVGGL